MRFDNESVCAEVHGLLAERGNEVAASADVGGVADDGQSGDAAAQFDGNLPHGEVAVDCFVVAGEAAVDGTEFFDAGTVESLQCANP